MSPARYYGVARSPAEREAGFAVRKAVFCDEQGVDPEAEFDALDEQATHVVGVEAEGVVAACRLRFDGATCRLERMAVTIPRRGSGAGRRLLAAIEAEALGRGADQILAHAQRRAEWFYAGSWFHAEGETFLEEGIEHVLMRKRLHRG